jgi:hypothetical protein
MMRRTLFLLSFVLAAGPASADMHGRYVEARTASVLAGACHFGGEVVTRGRDVVLAFRVDAGREDGVDLAGTAALAVVSSSENLREAEGVRRSILIIDAAASEKQAEALASAIEARHRGVLGEVVARKRAPVRFEERSGAIEVVAPGYAALVVEALPDRACCTMPHLVWYTPLVPLSDRRVGHTVRAESTGGGVLPAWADAGENTSFFGSF